MSLDLNNADLETFSKYLGLDGIDADLFYETYYNLMTDEELEDSLWEEQINQHLGT